MKTSLGSFMKCVNLLLDDMVAVYGKGCSDMLRYIGKIEIWVSKFGDDLFGVVFLRIIENELWVFDLGIFIIVSQLLCDLDEGLNNIGQIMVSILNQLLGGRCFQYLS